MWLFASLLAVAIAAIAFMAGRWANSRTSDAPMLWTSILAPEKPFKDVVPAAMLSPDGRVLAFQAPNAAGQNVIWVRSLDSGVARALPATEDSLELFWSPDGRSLGFFAGGRLKRIDLAGSAPQILANAADPRGGSWARDDTILFVPDGKTVHRIHASGGASAEVTHLNADRRDLIHGWPSFLPRREAFPALGLECRESSTRASTWGRSTPANCDGCFRCGLERNMPTGTCSSAARGT